jgi:hypothetical protein
MVGRGAPGLAAPRLHVSAAVAPAAADRTQRSEAGCPCAPNPHLDVSVLVDQQVLWLQVPGVGRDSSAGSVWRPFERAGIPCLGPAATYWKLGGRWPGWGSLAGPACQLGREPRLLPAGVRTLAQAAGKQLPTIPFCRAALRAPRSIAEPHLYTRLRLCSASSASTTLAA